MQLIPGHAYLRIADDGLSYCGLSLGSLFHITSIPWSAIDRFYIISRKCLELRNDTGVACTFVPSYKGKKLICFFNSIIFCFKVLIIPTPLGHNLRELAILDTTNGSKKYTEAPPLDELGMTHVSDPNIQVAVCGVLIEDEESGHASV